MPHLIKLHNAYGDSLQVLTVNPINPVGRVKAEIARMEIPFPVLTGRGSRIIVDYEVRGLPKIVIIDKQGKIFKSAGYITPEDLEKSMDELLSRQKDTGSGE